MKEQLIISGELADIPKGSIVRRIKVSSISDISFKGSSYSTQFKVPRTANNNKIFGLIGSMGDTSRKVYNEIRADYVAGSTILVRQGYIKIERVSNDFIFIRLIDGIIDIASKVGNKKISDLETSDLNHYINAQLYLDSFTNTSGYIYAMGDFGNGTNKVEFQRPSIFTHTIWNKIFSAIGVNYEGNFFANDADFLNEVITPVKGVVYADSGETNTSKGGIDSDTITYYDNTSNFFQREQLHTFTNNTLLDITLDGVTADNITIDVAANYRFTITNTWSNTTTNLGLIVKVNGASKSYIYLPEGNNQTKTTDVNLSLEVGDVVTFNSYASPSFNENEQSYTLSYSITSDIVVNAVTGGNLVDISDIIGDMRQIDFIKDVSARHGLYMTPVNGNTNSYRFKKISNVLSDRSNFIDWTDKIYQIRDKSYNSALAKNNNFKFSYPNKAVFFAHDGVMNINDFNLADQKDFYTSPFEIPTKVGAKFGENLYSFPLLEDSGATASETPNKVMNLKNVNGSMTVQYFSGATIPYNGDIPFLSVEGIDMQKYINTNYAQYTDLMNNFREVELKVNLSVIDIYNLRFDRLYFCKQLGRYLFLNEVRNEIGKVSTVSANVISNFPINQPPTRIGNIEFTINKQGVKLITLDQFKSAGYYDAEFDEPKEVRILTGFGNEVKMYDSNDNEITAQTDLTLSQLPVKIVDTSASTDARSHSFTYTMSDVGSGQFSAAIGTISIYINEYIPSQVYANAGVNQNIIFNEGDSHLEKYAYLNGSGSSSSDEIIYYGWEIVSKPAHSTAELVTTANSNPYTSLRIPSFEDNAGTYTIRLTVRTEYLIEDTDEMTVTVNINNGNK